MITKDLGGLPAANKYLYHDVDENKRGYRIALGKGPSSIGAMENRVWVRLQTPLTGLPEKLLKT